MTDYYELKKQLEHNNAKLGEALPAELKGFMDLHNAALTDGALDPKTKELIALGISICIKCEPCITAHTASLIKLGVSRKEIEETIGVALFMGGGPATAYGGKTLEAYDQLSEKLTPATI